MAGREAVVGGEEAAVNGPISDAFLFGASVYPENQSRDERLRLLGPFARMNLKVRREGIGLESCRTGCPPSARPDC